METAASPAAAQVMRSAARRRTARRAASWATTTAPTLPMTRAEACGRRAPSPPGRSSSRRCGDGAEQVPAPTQRIGQQREEVLALEEEQREVVRDEPADRQRDEGSARAQSTATVVCVAVSHAGRRLPAAPNAGRRRRSPTPDESHGVEGRAFPAGAGAEHVDPEVARRDAVEQRAARARRPRAGRRLRV